MAIVVQSLFRRVISHSAFIPAFFIVAVLAGVAVVAGMMTPFPISLILVAVLVGICGIVFVVFWRLVRCTMSTIVAEARMNTIVARIGVGVVAYDANFRVTMFNAAAEEIFQLSSDAVIGKVLSAQLGGDKQFSILTQTVFSSLASRVVRRSEEGAYPQIVDISFSDPDMELHVITDRIVGADGAIEGFIKLISDRTREAQLVKARNEFLSVAAHQLRTPLTAVHWSLESLSKSDHLDTEEKTTALTGFEASKKMLKTVNDLLDASKMEEGKFGYTFESVDISSFVQQVLSSSMVVARQFGIKLYFRPAAQPTTVVIDSQKVAMALSNLVDNAIKYNVQNGEVTVSILASDDPSFVTVSVEDTGIGIPAEDKDNIFQKFYRSKEVSKHVADGTGLGLYIVRNIITHHGGTIWFESEPNRGTTFFFTLPRVEDVIPKRELSQY